MKRPTVVVAVFAILCVSVNGIASAAEPATWKAGVATVKITPEEPYFLAGYGGEKRVATEKRHDLWIKVLALEDAKGRRGALLTVDICGFDRVSYDAICEGLRRRSGLDRSQILLNFTHNHSGPVTRNSLMSFHAFTPDDLAKIDAYTKDIEQKAIEAAVEAFGRLAPATLHLGAGETNFAMNRRNNGAELVADVLAKGESLKGPTDRHISVLAVRSPDGKLIAVMFAYSCHPVTPIEPIWSGDFPGFAMIELEKSHPETTALFCQASGGDQNPIFRGTIDMAQDYGHRLATAVNAVLAQPMTAIEPELDTVNTSITLNYERLPTREELEEAIRRAKGEMPAAERNIAERKARWATGQLAELDARGQLPTGYPYPIEAWLLGNRVLWIGLAGETVADYALMLAQEVRAGDHRHRLLRRHRRLHSHRSHVARRMGRRSRVRLGIRPAGPSLDGRYPTTGSRGGG